MSNDFYLYGDKLNPDDLPKRLVNGCLAPQHGKFNVAGAGNAFYTSWDTFPYSPFSTFFYLFTPPILW
jgi:hypothetical protein